MRLASRIQSRPIEGYAALALAVIAGSIVFGIASGLFPYHSVNHDEGVYLQQASLLRAGKLHFAAGPLADAFRPWFFIEDAGRLYPKYAPVPAALFAVGALFGEHRFSLALIASGNVLLCYLIVTQTFDRGRGLLAAGILSAAPLFLFSSAVFLPYAPTTFLNLLFVVSYIYAARRDSYGYAALAGLAIGLAFFSRPYTALLVAIPFLGHAAWTTWHGFEETGFGAAVVKRNLTTAAFGSLLVMVTFTYNAIVTGDPLVFPYEAFAPHDGIGFGHRQLLGHSIEYTPSLALKTTSYVIWYFATRWFTAGLIGISFVLIGIALVLTEDDPRQDDISGSPTPAELRLLLLGVLITVIAGNLAFWGNYNILASMSDPTTGLISLFGPIYHFDALLPLSAFAAHGAHSTWTRLRTLIPRLVPTHARHLLGGVLLITLLAVSGVTIALVDGPADRNAAYTSKYHHAYEPFEQEQLAQALVFIPTPYGDWLNHPFQYLRNEPSLDGPVVFALDRGVARNFNVLDAYPNRSYYRYTYHGTWTAAPTDHVVAKLDRVTVEQGNTIHGETTVGVPANAEHATIRLETDTNGIEYVVAERLGEQLQIGWIITNASVRVTGDGIDTASGYDSPVIPVNGTETVRLNIQFVHPGGATLTYEQHLSVDANDDGVRVIWPGRRYICPIVTQCGRSGTYLPDHPDVHATDVSFESEILGPATN